MYASYDLNNRALTRLVPMAEYKRDEVSVKLGMRYKPHVQELERVDLRVALPIGETVELSYDSIYTPPSQRFTKGQISISKDLHCRKLVLSYDHVAGRFAVQLVINAFPTLPIGWDSKSGLSLFDLEDVADIIDVKGVMNLSTKAKRLIAAGVVLVGVILFITFRYLATPAPPAVSVPPSVQLVESRLVGRKEGQRQWEIVSRMVLQEGDVVTLSELEEMIVFQDGEPYLSIDTPRAQWQRKQEILHLHGPVLVEGKEGFQLESDFLEWQGRTNMLSSPGPVRIIWRGMEITASEMAMDTEEGVVHLKRDVEIRDEGLVWKLEEVVYNLDAESMDFYGNVLMEEEAGSD